MAAAKRRGVAGTGFVHFQGSQILPLALAMPKVAELGLGTSNKERHPIGIYTQSEMLPIRTGHLFEST